MNLYLLTFIVDTISFVLHRQAACVISNGQKKTPFSLLTKKSEKNVKTNVTNFWLSLPLFYVPF